MKRIYIPNYIYTDELIKKGYAVLIEDNIIADIKSSEQLISENPDAEVIEWADTVIVPGTINAHNHSFQSLLRGIATDRPFLEWRENALYKFSPRMRIEDIYNGAVFAFSEMMKCGVTTVCDFFYLHNYGLESDEAIVRAAKDVGIRLVIARTMYDWDGAPEGYQETIEQAVSNTKALAKKYNGSDMVKIIPAPHSLHAASPEMIIAGHRLAKELGTGYHIHVAEEPFEVEETKKNHNGMYTVEYLDSLGVVDESMSIIHGVWLKESEIKILGDKGASLIYCPSSNMFLADGITDIPLMMGSGVKIALGSDGACSNNRISVFEEMRMVSILQKAKTCNAMAFNFMDSMKMGTSNGAEILGIKAGKLEIGYKADFVAVSLKDLSMQPLSDSGEQLIPNLIYSMQPTAIKNVVINGNQTVKDGELLTVNEDSIINQIKNTITHLERED